MQTDIIAVLRRVAAAQGGVAVVTLVTHDGSEVHCTSTNAAHIESLLRAFASNSLSTNCETQGP